MQSFILEVIITFILMFVILRVATGAKEQGLYAGIAIGSVVLTGIIFAGPISGGSMNPVRSLGPALAGNHVEHLWVYFIAPPAGASLAVIASRFLKAEH
jgi:aquaporin Z